MYKRKDTRDTQDKCSNRYSKRKQAYGRSLSRSRRDLAVLVSSLCLALISAILLGSFLTETEARAQAPEDTYYKYYTSVELQPGDTIWELAENYIDGHYESREAYIQEVCELNALTDEDSIIAGQHLILPYYSLEYKS